MGRTYLAVAMFVLLAVSPSFGQYVSVIQACTRDIEKSCTAGQQGAGPLAECIKTHFEDFTEPRRAALLRISAVREACGADIQKQCSGVRPGAGRILLRMKQRFAAMSESCKDAIGHAAERKVGAPPGHAITVAIRLSTKRSKSSGAT